jgi:hypothetical protein
MIKLADLQYRIFAASAHGGSWHRADNLGTTNDLDGNRRYKRPVRLATAATARDLDCVEKSSNFPGGSCAHRKLHAESRASAYDRLDPDAAAMHFDNLLGNR